MLSLRFLAWSIMSQRPGGGQLPVAARRAMVELEDRHMRIET
jgi:hypothetical protein